MVGVNDVLGLLAERRNVLLSGPPGTGKSHLLTAVANRFELTDVVDAAAYAPDGDVAVPEDAGVPAHLPEGMAVPNRKVFRAVMHQSSKYRDFLTGVMPDLRPGMPPGQFRIVEGILFKASEFARQADNAALLIIDEINRGPAVQVFGGSIVAIEGEKRLAEDGSRRPETQYFDVLDPATGELVEYAFPSRLYILAAMNQADVSVEPLDVAFLRRWAPVRLEPSPETLREHFGLPAAGGLLPIVPNGVNDVYEAAVQAFEAVNARIALGRGPEFRIGHGVLMVPSGGVPGTEAGASAHIATAWTFVRNHVEEAFFGDVRGMAIVLNAGRGVDGHPLNLKEETFGDAPRAVLTGPIVTESDSIYALLRAVAARSAEGQ